MLVAIDVWRFYPENSIGWRTPVTNCGHAAGGLSWRRGGCHVASVDATTARTCCPNRDARAFRRPGPAVAQPSLGPHDRWLAAACRPPRTRLLLPDVITYRCDRAVGLTVDNQNRRHPHNDSVCCRRDSSRTRPRCMLPHATVTDALVPVLPAVERQRMASRVMV